MWACCLQIVKTGNFGYKFAHKANAEVRRKNLILLFLEVNSYDVINRTSGINVGLYEIFEPNVVYSSRSRQSLRWNVRNSLIVKFKMAATSILNIERCQYLRIGWTNFYHNWWADASRPCGDDRMNRNRNMKLIRNGQQLKDGFQSTCGRER